MGQKKKFNYVDFILKYLSVILMIIALIYIGVNNHYFFKVNNIISILLQTASLTPDIPLDAIHKQAPYVIVCRDRVTINGIIFRYAIA